MLPTEDELWDSIRRRFRWPAIALLFALALWVVADQLERRQLAPPTLEERVRRLESCSPCTVVKP